MNSYNSRRESLSLVVKIIFGITFGLILAWIVVVVVAGVAVVTNPEATVEGAGRLFKLFKEAAGI